MTRYQIFQTAKCTALRVGKFGLRIIFKGAMDGQRKTAKIVGHIINAKGSANLTRYQIFQMAKCTALRVGKFGLRIIFKGATDGQRKTAKIVSGLRSHIINAKGKAGSANVTRYQIFQTAKCTALRVGKFGLRIIFKGATDGQRKTAKIVGQ